jgi:isochorismate synthase
MFLASARHTLLARGVRASIEVRGGSGQWDSLPGRVREALAAHRTPGSSPVLAVGALAFDERVAAVLTIPETVDWAGPLGKSASQTPLATLATRNSRSVPSGADYAAAVGRVVDRIRGGALRKAVLARSLELTAVSPVDVAALVSRLAAGNPAAYTFALDLSRATADVTPPGNWGSKNDGAVARTLIGASPELLVSRNGLDVFANPLAGSAARSSDANEDARRAERLLGSQKNQEEHAFVVEGVAATLEPFCTQLEVPSRPSLLRTDTMWHLSTAIRGVLRDPSICALTLATALHPTAAVCGTPRAEAMATIREFEPFERGFYAGLLGWCSDQGDGEWVVTIRCGEIQGERIRLYAGAGIVEQSTPAEELAETSAKFHTLLRALGMDSPP